MGNRLILLFGIIASIQFCFGQEEEPDHPSMTVFLELGGKGFASLNYNYHFNAKHELGFALTLLDYEWVDYTKVDSMAYGTIPTPGLMYYFLTGKKNHHLELGAGASILPYGGVDYGKYDSPFSLHGVIGYRYEKKKGLIIRAGFTPFYRVNWVFLPLAGFSIGYSW